jgi:hypothetical protein
MREEGARSSRVVRLQAPGGGVRAQLVQLFRSLACWHFIGLCREASRPSELRDFNLWLKWFREN